MLVLLVVIPIDNIFIVTRMFPQPCTSFQAQGELKKNL
jgi:hypothetical protein